MGITPSPVRQMRDSDGWFSIASDVLQANSGRLYICKSSQVTPSEVANRNIGLILHFSDDEQPAESIKVGNNYGYVNDKIDLMLNSGRSVLIHSTSALNRTSYVAIRYLIHRGLDFERAHIIVERDRIEEITLTLEQCIELTELSR